MYQRTSSTDIRPACTWSLRGRISFNTYSQAQASFGLRFSSIGKTQINKNICCPLTDGNIFSHGISPLFGIVHNAVHGLEQRGGFARRCCQSFYRVSKWGCLQDSNFDLSFNSESKRGGFSRILTSAEMFSSSASKRQLMISSMIVSFRHS